MADTLSARDREFLRKRFEMTRFRGVPRYIFAWLHELAGAYPELEPIAGRGTATHAMEYREGSLRMLPEFDRLAKRSEGRRARFVAWILVFQTKADFHGNLCLLDWKERTLLRFEPRGTSTTLPGMDRALHQLGARWGCLYTSPAQYQAMCGPQCVEVLNVDRDSAFLPESGPCVIWDLLFLHIKLEYPELTCAQIAAVLRGHAPIATALIEAYGHFITRRVD